MRCILAGLTMAFALLACVPQAGKIEISSAGAPAADPTVSDGGSTEPGTSPPAPLPSSTIGANNGSPGMPNAALGALIGALFDFFPSHDLVSGPGENNDLVGRNSWACKQLFGGCGGEPRRSEGVGLTLLPATDRGVSEGLTFCALMRRRMAASDCAYYQDQRDSLQAGIGAFNPPKQMVLRQPYTLRLAIALNGASAGTIFTARQPVTVTVPTLGGRFMKATLGGAGFTIAPLDRAERDLGASDEAAWSWTVTPEQPGPKVLMLAIEAQAEGPDGHLTPLKLYSKYTDVLVTVTAGQKVDEAVTQVGAATKRTTSLFASITESLVALAALLGGLSGLRLAWRKMRTA